MEQIWMVWIRGRQGPQKTHTTEAAAHTEAERLLRLADNAGHEVVLLKAVAVGRIVAAPVVWAEME